MTQTPRIRRAFVEVHGRSIHTAQCGEGVPVLLLHQTPRSWDEYRDVLPLLGRHCRAVAMDTAGFGDSDPLPEGTESIEAWADVALGLLDALGIGEAFVVGHHTGAVIAFEIAARKPERVRGLVLSACPWIDQARRDAYAGPEGARKHVIDAVERRPDGSHLLDLWSMRRPFYPEGDIDLLERFMADALKAGRLAAGGHRVVSRYVMDQRAPLIACPTLVIAPTDDPHVYPKAPIIAAAVGNSRIIEIPGGQVPLPDGMPEVFADTVLAFLEEHRS